MSTATVNEWPRRSQLFVPAHVDKFAAKAVTLDVDGVVLDLEDAVPAAERAGARHALARRTVDLSATSRVIVRVNADGDLPEDLRACQDAGVSEVLLPKVSGPHDIERFLDLCGDIGYSTRLSILVESAAGLTRIHQILASTAIETVCLGAEDLRAELELFAPTHTTSQTLMAAHAQVVLAALAADVTPLGLLGSISQYKDTDTLWRTAVASWQAGYRGAYCVHPLQVDVFNASFRPTDDDIWWAERVIAGGREARAQGRGAFVVDGDMVDAPLVARAREIVTYVRRIESRFSLSGVKTGSVSGAAGHLSRSTR